MMTNAIDRINELTRERIGLYRQAANGRRGDVELKRQIAAVNSELEALWDQRRQEQAGAAHGIDRVIDNAYRQIYGPNYEDTFTPKRATEERLAA